mmetsp:Transcript_15043/g.63441  ORF Transcript_15043/g.63441 Transcript_15043/m.63441 type:complete len:234 (+) Transcript_15043:188-889(+)
MSRPFESTSAAPAEDSGISASVCTASRMVVPFFEGTLRRRPEITPALMVVCGLYAPFKESAPFTSPAPTTYALCPTLSEPLEPSGSAAGRETRDSTSTSPSTSPAGDMSLKTATSEARCVPTTTASYHVAFLGSPPFSAGTFTRNRLCEASRFFLSSLPLEGEPGTKSFTTWKLVTTKPPCSNAAHTTPVPRGVYPPFAPFGSYTASDTTERDAVSNTRVAFASSTSASAGSV